MQSILVTLILLQTTGITVASQVLERMGVDNNYLLFGLIAFIVVGLTAHKNLLFIVLILLLTTAIQLPQTFLLEFSIDPDVLLATLLVLVLSPLAERYLT